MSEIITDSSPTHRIGLTENEILALIEELADIKNSTGLTVLLRNAYVKLVKKYTAVDNGTVRADYVPNGRKRESAVNLDSLGASSSEKKSAGGIGSYNNSAELDDDALEAAMQYERDMLAEQKALGNKNVVDSIEELNAVIGRDVDATDNENMHAALMAHKTVDLTKEI